MPNPFSNIPTEHWGAAQDLRQQATLAEKKLWVVLRSYGQGVKFRRQHPIGPFIVDFYSPECRLVIEIEGKVHDDPDVAQRDAERTAYLERAGMCIIRFSNTDVLHHFEEVLARLKNDISRRLDTQPGFTDTCK